MCPWDIACVLRPELLLLGGMNGAWLVRGRVHVRGLFGLRAPQAYVLEVVPAYVESAVMID